MQNKLVFIKLNVLLRATLATLSLIALCLAAHWLKNLYLGEYVTYQEHFNSTVKVNLLLIIASFCIARFVWKEFAFTLVELSIVLIIIGFIIAGISAGVSMVQASRLNGVITEVRNMQTAIMNFRSRYNAVPGDIPNAFQTFGSTCGTNDSGQANSCNGNGNAFIDSQAGTTPPIEDVKFWQHLSLGGMLPNNFTGQAIATVRHIVGQNAPGSAYGSGAGYQPNGAGNFYNFKSRVNSMMLAGYDLTTTTFNAPLMMPTESIKAFPFPLHEFA